MPKVLIADDSTFMRTLLADILNKNGFSDIVEASDGEKAVQLYDAEKPDLVLLDVIMPQMDGLAVLSNIAAKGAKVIIISAVGQESMIDRAMKSGARGYIVKPFDESQVVEEVKKFI
ncbi:response regulator [Patescibacteria group bacterium]|nr:response regulator [Patescibacteria group bacterium]